MPPPAVGIEDILRLGVYVGTYDDIDVWNYLGSFTLVQIPQWMVALT